MRTLKTAIWLKSFEPEDEDELAFINTLDLLTWKPVIFAANVSEDDLADDGASNEYVKNRFANLQLRTTARYLIQ